MTGYILAAANPAIEFTGIDIDEDALELARRRAESGGLDNCVYKLPENDHISADRFSVVFAHGLYSWVDATTRESLHEFFRDGITENGLLFLSYNLRPGWDCISVIRGQFLSSLEESPDDPEAAATRALRRLVELRDAGALAFRDNKAAGGFLNYLLEMDDIQYSVQEFYGTDQQAFWFHEIHDAMRRCGLAYAADASVPENRIDLVIGEAGFGLLEQCDSTLRFQATKDLLQNRLFRRDIYIAGELPEVSGKPGDRAFDSIRLGIYGLSPGIPRTIRTDSGKHIELSDELVDRLESHYRKRTFCIRDLLADDGIAAEYDELEYNLLVLITEGYIGPFARDFRQEPGQAFDRIAVPLSNRVLIETPEEAHQKIYLASPVVGSGVQVVPRDGLLLRAFEHEDPGRWLANRAPQAADGYPAYETAVQEHFASASDIDDRVHDFRSRLAAYISLGVVKPIAG